MNSDNGLGWRASIGDNDRQQQRATPGVDGLAKAGAPIGRVAGVIHPDAGKKSVLLVDSNRQSRESRAKVMRTLGVRVDSVASADTARVRLAAEKYDLILVDLGRDISAAELLVGEIRTKNSRQLVGFLVGRPMFIAQSLSGNNAHQPRVPALASVESVQKANSPTGGDDFGQKIRDAEAQQKEVA